MLETAPGKYGSIKENIAKTDENAERSFISKLLTDRLFILAVFSTIAFAMRFFLFGWETGDYGFLKTWSSFLGDNGYLSAFQHAFSDYTPLYLYYLAIIAYFNANLLLWAKLLSVVFDFIIAVYIHRIMAIHYKNRPFIADASYILVLFIPTILLNGSMWGQCDSIYSCFMLMSVFYLLTDKKIKALMCFGAAFSLKLQSIFLLPVFFLYLLDGKLKFSDFFIVPAVYIITILPSVIRGASFIDQLTVYARQTNTYTKLFSNFPNIYNWLSDNTILIPFGVFGTLAAVLFLCVIAEKRKLIRKKLFILEFSYLLTVLIPFLLPRMHDRYLFQADVFAVIYFIGNRNRWYIPVTTWILSFAAYINYLFGIYPVDFKILAVIYLAAVILLVIDILYKDKKSVQVW